MLKSSIYTFQILLNLRLIDFDAVRCFSLLLFELIYEKQNIIANILNNVEKVVDIAVTMTFKLTNL